MAKVGDTFNFKGHPCKVVYIKYQKETQIAELEPSWWQHMKPNGKCVLQEYDIEPHSLGDIIEIEREFARLERCDGAEAPWLIYTKFNIRKLREASNGSH